MISFLKRIFSLNDRASPEQIERYYSSALLTPIQPGSVIRTRPVNFINGEIVPVLQRGAELAIGGTMIARVVRASADRAIIEVGDTRWLMTSVKADDYNEGSYLSSNGVVVWIVRGWA